MQNVPVKIIGISATGVIGGNCDKVMQDALETATGFEQVDTEFITLADKEIMTCTHCQWCIENAKPCKYTDDANWILEKMEKADGFIWGAPVWSHTIPPHMINLISRARYQCFYTGSLRNKVLGTFVVSWFGVGEEMALMTLEALGHNYLLLPVYRGWARVSSAAFGQRPQYLENGALEDSGGMARIRTMAKRVVEVSRKIRFADNADVGVSASETRSITCGKYPKYFKNKN